MEERNWRKLCLMKMWDLQNFMGLFDTEILVHTILSIFDSLGGWARNQIFFLLHFIHFFAIDKFIFISKGVVKIFKKYFKIFHAIRNNVLPNFSGGAKLFSDQFRK